jgi:hypothetical protein
MNNHNDFILKPITAVLNEGVNASLGIGSGIETYPLYDYISQSVFLKMTGFQEQKMKCIYWELASNDYDYRRVLLSNEDKLGECSSYKDKSNIYKRLVEQIRNYDSDFNVTNIEKNKIRKGTALKIKEIFSNTNLFIWGQGAFNNYELIWKSIENKHFATENNSLFPEIKNGISLKFIYENHLYKHRNRVAHNTHSYQQNLPTLKTLVNENYIYENYFLWFALLVLIDNIFIDLYKKYLSVIEDN